MSLIKAAVLGLTLIACSTGKEGDGDGDGFTSAVDCDDADPGIFPAAEELCDGLDNDCDGSADELAADAATWSVDGDGDGYGEPSYTVTSCERPEGYSPSAGDCDDTAETVFPGASEQCDDVDNDCDGLVDEDDPDLNLATASSWYPDGDGDGYGDAGADGVVACSNPSTASETFVNNAEDCDDSTALAAPGLAEACGDGLDNNCDGSDEGCTREGVIGTDAARARVIGAEGDGLGAALSAVDLDGDGLDDVLAGAPGADGGRGAVQAFSSPLVGTLGSDTAVLRLEATADGQGLGETVLGLDLDGDGYGDVVAGLWRASTVAWLAGPARGTLPALPGDGDLSGLDGLGAALAADRDEEGALSLVSGAPDADGGGGEGSGVVAVLGGPWGEAGTLDSAATVLGDQPGLGLGERVAVAGDVNGDGLLDILISAPGGADGAGLAALALGPLTGALSLTDADARWTGLSAGDGLGAGLAGAGDADDDGDDDVLLGAPDVAGAEPEAGAVWVISGDPTALASDLGLAAARLDGEGGAQLGASLAPAGRFDGDRQDDVLLGAPGAEACWVVSGPVEGVLAMADAALLLVGDEGGGLGASLTAASLDGDDQGDVLIGAPEDGMGGADGGVVWLLTGSGW